MPQLTQPQRSALDAARNYFGRGWKGQLRDCWLKAAYPAALQSYQAELQIIRNGFGSTWLTRFQF